jgi:replicative superfamily II helicase
MLVCAPTGAGKTNVAMLATTAHFRDVGLIGGGGCSGDYYEDSNNNNNNESSTTDTGPKVVYIAPMKALAQEVVSRRLSFGLVLYQFWTIHSSCSFYFPLHVVFDRLKG